MALCVLTAATAPVLADVARDATLCSDAKSSAEVVIEAKRLGLDIGSEAVLARYQSWRRFDNALFTASMDGLNRLFSNDIAPLRAARRLGLAAVNAAGPARRFFMKYAGGAAGDLPKLLRGESLAA